MISQTSPRQIFLVNKILPPSCVDHNSPWQASLQSETCKMLKWNIFFRDFKDTGLKFSTNYIIEPDLCIDLPFCWNAVAAVRRIRDRGLKGMPVIIMTAFFRVDSFLIRPSDVQLLDYTWKVPTSLNRALAIASILWNRASKVHKASIVSTWIEERLVLGASTPKTISTIKNILDLDWRLHRNLKACQWLAVVDTINTVWTKWFFDL